MAILTKEIKLSEFTSMSAQERARRVDDLFQSALRHSRKDVEDRIKEIDKQILEFECKYQMKSSVMQGLVELGQMPETIDICQWLKLVAKRARFDEYQSKAST